MSKEELLELTGEVIEKLPNAMFRVKLETGLRFWPIPREKCANSESGSWSAIRSISK